MSEQKSDFIVKLRQIEEQANLAVAGMAAGLLRSRLLHMAVLARTLRGRLEAPSVAIVRLDPGAPLAGEPKKPPA